MFRQRNHWKRFYLQNLTMKKLFTILDYLHKNRKNLLRQYIIFKKRWRLIVHSQKYIMNLATVWKILTDFPRHCRLMINFLILNLTMLMAGTTGELSSGR